MFADQERMIRFWNKGVEQILSFSEEEVLGYSPDLIIPEKLRGRHWLAYHQVL